MSLESQIVEILGRSSVALSARELSIRVRQRDRLVADYQVTRILHKLVGVGGVEYRRGRWLGTQAPAETAQDRPHLSIVAPQPMSPDIEAILSNTYAGRGDEGQPGDWMMSTESSPESSFPHGRWGGSNSNESGIGYGGPTGK